ncbi:helix-turn-helix transcriptional regulator [Paraburkholderia caballeronis]|uniref:Prophage CP4-57 regulatory protein (AlpA) n=1 Tax=Paraburkholderia caballeronis TaxID=416943 RepID=A0A1H7TK69_9BURK|nr:AlpA family phage regulatory protein [Paraburkholderia caballeronis]PXW18435.1 AlpA family transcriptional regulator [Paraburkholderia caballeronis]PXW95715.1 AlpA family transcriptional regulator [Paraburkholderia caballeronis]RAJ92061.1 AlpA family transcriptional regulator [Paraburkholderia caballeronis]SEB76041.1 transcriptional regulator, AlpA family [Paraburkholderia caballeronis]SEL85240.1 Prophage CP4-57 regulatory protein (AlpA) [Paraburkholderia caballeronis]
MTPPNRRAMRAARELPLDGFSRWSDLQRFIPVSRETVRQHELAGRFPRHQKITQRCTVWPNREIHRWLADPVNYRASDIIGEAA